MSGPPSLLMENYLREADFWHRATIGRGCKLDLKLIRALIERWRPETHTFHLLCGKCTITLEDVQLQLGLPVDGAALTGSIQSANWGAICYDYLGAIQDNIYGDQIEMSWLRDTFPESGNDSIELESIRYARAYIFEMIRGYLMPDLWNHSASYVGIPTALEDIPLLLDQQSEAQSYARLGCIARCISFPNDSDSTNDIGHCRPRDCRGHRQRAHLITIPHRLMGFKHFCRG
ncbi:hypothetical protein PVK06_025627 [Gossypium arboreum]|uniref:Aminotransferase-like plant mobile domain-containing protein n=1 Tax=Gossypium arboreum TaxID=29729 RepID=A0ABR0PHC7_GOSAR|nr:hypothetical protein PVK06_025627 [Gossypium arboreum]